MNESMLVSIITSHTLSFLGTYRTYINLRYGGKSIEEKTNWKNETVISRMYNIVQIAEESY